MSGQLNSFTIQLADETWLHVFSHLSQKDLCRVARVSTRFKRLALDPSLWQKIELQKVSLSLEAWQGIVSRCSRLSSLTLQKQDNPLGLLAVVAQSGRKLRHLEVLNDDRPPIECTDCLQENPDRERCECATFTSFTFVLTHFLLQLRSLNVSHSKMVSNEGLVKIADLGVQLKELKIGFHDAASVKHLLCHGPPLQKFRVSLFTDEEEDVPQHLTNLAGSLEELDIINTMALGQKGKLAVMQLPKLKVLKLGLCRDDRHFFDDLSSGMLQNLCQLHLSFDQSVTGDSLRLVAQHCQKLEFLYLLECCNVRDLSDFVSTCKSLRRLILLCNKRLCGRFLERIPKYLPSFQCLEVIRCVRIEKSLLRDFAKQNPLIEVVRLIKLRKNHTAAAPGVQSHLFHQLT
jgi:hypothetical protein